MMESLKKKRVSWIDIAKGIAILLVFFGHTLSTPKEFADFIYSFHMPVFFALSGYCFSLKGNFRDFITKKAKGILLPVFTLGLTGSVAVSLMLTFIKHEAVDWKWVFLNPFVQYGTHDLLWYLPAAFVSMVCFYLLVKLCKKKMWLIVSVSFVIGLLSYLFTEFVKIEIPWQIDTALVALPFLAVGYFMKEKNAVAEIRNVPFLLISTVVCVLISILNNKFFGRVEMHINSYGNLLLFYLGALAGICMTISVSMLISENKALEFFGRNTLIFYSLEPIQYFANFVLGLCIGFIPYYDNIMIRFAVSAVAVIFVTAFSSLAAVIINRYFPFLIGQRRKTHERGNENNSQKTDNP